MSDQRTLKESGLPRQFADMVEAWCGEYRGGIPRLELAKGHPDVKSRFYDFLNGLADERQAAMPHEQRPAWKTVTLGTHPSAEKLKADITADGTQVSDWAWDIMRKTPLATEPQEVSLYRVTVGELGFTSRATKAQIYERALSLGYVLLPAEVGPQLRLQYADQPNPEYIWVGMEPITGSAGIPSVFYVSRGSDGRWLNGDYADPGRTWRPDGSWVFGRK